MRVVFASCVCVFFNENNIRVHDFLSLRAAGARLVQDENGGHKSAVSRGRGRGRATEKADERGDLPRTMRDAGGVSRQKAEVGGVRPSNAADDYIEEDGGGRWRGEERRGEERRV